MSIPVISMDDEIVTMRYKNFKFAISKCSYGCTASINLVYSYDYNADTSERMIYLASEIFEEEVLERCKDCVIKIITNWFTIHTNLLNDFIFNYYISTMVDYYLIRICNR